MLTNSLGCATARSVWMLQPVAVQSALRGMSVSKPVTVQVHSCTDALTDVSPRYLVKPVPVQVHSCTDALTDVSPRYLVIISRFVFVTCIAGAQKEPSASSRSSKTRRHLLGFPFVWTTLRIGHWGREIESIYVYDQLSTVLRP